MYCLFSGLFAILHVAVQPFDDRNNQMLDTLETVGLVTAFVTQVLFQLIITFDMSITLILSVLFVCFILNFWVSIYMLRTLFREYLQYMGKKSLAAEEEQMRAKLEEMD